MELFFIENELGTVILIYFFFEDKSSIRYIYNINIFVKYVWRLD